MSKTSKHRKETSTSKKLLLFFYGVALLLTLTAVRMANLPEPNTEAVSIMARLTEIWYGGTTLITGFYLWKARSENRNKYSQLWYEKIAEKDGWEAAARFAELVTKGD